MLYHRVNDSAGYGMSDHTASHNGYPSALAGFTGLQAQEGRVAQFDIGHMEFDVFNCNFCCSGLVTARSHQVEFR